MFMLSEEYIRREKQVAEGYKRYFDSRPGMKEEIDKLFVLLEKNKITPEELRERALELGKKYG